MKKLLLSFALCAAAALPVAAQDYVVYVGTQAENGTVTNYQAVTDAANVLTVNPFYEGEDLSCEAFMKVANNTASDVSATVYVNKLDDHNVFGDAFVVFQTCLGASCMEPPFSFTVPANGETPGGAGEHIGYSALSLTEQEAAAVTFDSSYLVTVAIGDFSQSFTLNFSGNTAGVNSVMADGAAAEYFNLQGMRVASPSKGEVYIVRRGGKVSKTLVR